jgi:hypothetical protein
MRERRQADFKKRLSGGWRTVYIALAELALELIGPGEPGRGQTRRGEDSGRYNIGTHSYH